MLEDINDRLWLSWACAVVFTETQAVYAEVPSLGSGPIDFYKAACFTVRKLGGNL
jgi:hypothetical protein